MKMPTAFWTARLTPVRVGPDCLPKEWKSRLGCAQSQGDLHLVRNLDVCTHEHTHPHTLRCFSEYFLLDLTRGETVLHLHFLQLSVSLHDRSPPFFSLVFQPSWRFNSELSGLWTDLLPTSSAGAGANGLRSRGYFKTSFCLRCHGAKQEALWSMHMNSFLLT